MPRVDRVAVETNGATEATPIFAPFFIVTSQGKTSERSTQKLVDVAAMRFDVAGNRRRRMLALLQAEFAQWLDLKLMVTTRAMDAVAVPIAPLVSRLSSMAVRTARPVA